MMKNWLNSASFAPPDVPGADAATLDKGTDTGTQIETPAGGAETIDPVKEAEPRVESVRESIKRASKETKAKAAAPAGKSADPLIQDGAPKGDTGKTSEAAQTGNTTTAQPSGPPTSWNAAEKALWSQLPPAAQAAITRREADAAKGVKELRERYTEFDNAIAPYAPTLKQNNVTPGQAVAQLFKWHMELAGPNKVQAFQQLAKNFGIDPATLAAPQAARQADDGNGIPENLRPVISNLEQRLKSYEESAAAQHTSAAQQTWNNWAKGKDHVEEVRGLMGQLINADLALIQRGEAPVSGTIKDGAIDLDAAYQAALYAHPGVRELVLQAEQAKRDLAARQAAERARKSGASLQSGAPAAQPGGPAGDGALVVESPRESIKRAIAAARGG